MKKIVDLFRQITYRPRADIQELTAAFMDGKDPEGKALYRGLRRNQRRDNKAALALHIAEERREKKKRKRF